MLDAIRLERDTLYNVVSDYNDVVFDQVDQKKSYYALPVVNS
ncbi:hypothetical protein [Sphingobacterium multivorum]|nr:hypothetical protein [Sphingobacterium multivorum]